MIQLIISMLLSLLILWPASSFISILFGVRINLISLGFVNFDVDPGFSPCTSTNSFNYSAFYWYILYFVLTTLILIVIHKKISFKLKPAILFFASIVSLVMVLNIVFSIKYIKKSHIEAPNSESCQKSNLIFESLDQKELK